MGKLKEQAQFVDNSTAQNQLYMTQIKELETRVQNLMDKVQEQADTVDRSNEKEHSYVQEKQNLSYVFFHSANIFLSPLHTIF